LDVVARMASNRDNSHEGTVQAGALMCPKCCVAFLEVEVDFEYDGIFLPNVKVLRCPACEEELFTPEQYHTINERIRNAVKP